MSTQVTPICIRNDANPTRVIVNGLHTSTQQMVKPPRRKFRYLIEINNSVEDDYLDYEININKSRKTNEDKIEKKSNIENELSNTMSENVYDGYCNKAVVSSRGTIRGVRNMVKEGVANFHRLYINNKVWINNEKGIVVIYTTSMGVVRDTAARCQKMINILKTNMIKFSIRDAFMSRAIQNELKDRMGMNQQVPLPQLFVEGEYIGDADVVEKLNESGELKMLLKPYQTQEAWKPCEVCGGYGVIPCAICNGTKKSVFRNSYTNELVALRCNNCEEGGLVRCYNC